MTPHPEIERLIKAAKMFRLPVSMDSSRDVDRAELACSLRAAEDWLAREKKRVPCECDVHFNRGLAAGRADGVKALEAVMEEAKGGLMLRENEWTVAEAELDAIVAAQLAALGKGVTR